MPRPASASPRRRSAQALRVIVVDCAREGEPPQPHMLANPELAVAVGRDC